MAATLDRDAVLNALRVVNDPDLRKDIVSLGFVKELAIDSGRGSFAIELTTPACPVKDQMRDQATAAVRALPGVTGVDVRMTANVRSVSAPEHGRPPLPGVKNVIAVGAGKGGVGKSTVAVNLALALARFGSRVGILDGDIYGPNVPIMLGLSSTQLTTDGKQIVPAEKYGVQVVSMGFLTQDDAPVIWRGPVLGPTFLTPPQQVSPADSMRAVRMYQKLNIPPIGLIENMSYFSCTNCHHESDIFGHGGGERLAEQMELRFFGRLPIYQPIREGGDSGVPIVVSEPGSAAGRAFALVAERTAAQVSIAAHKVAEANKGKIPLIPVR